MDDSIYTLKRYNKKKKKRSYKLLYLILYQSHKGFIKIVIFNNNSIISFNML